MQFLFRDVTWDDLQLLDPITLEWHNGKLYAIYVEDGRDKDLIHGLKLSEDQIQVNL